MCMREYFVLVDCEEANSFSDNIEFLLDDEVMEIFMGETIDCQISI